MLQGFEALQALAATGTMGRAGTRLRLSQSAVSKRIAALEEQLGETLIVREGRKVVLTPRAERLLVRLRPLVAELKAALADDDVARPLTLGVSESILGTWGPTLLAAVKTRLPEIALTLHAHRSPAVAERVTAGEYMLGLIAGNSALPALSKDTWITELGREPMVLIDGGAPGKPLITIESRSGTWQAIARSAAKLGLDPGLRVESFFAVARLALAGFGDGLVPIGVADVLKVPEDRRRHLGSLARPIVLVARPSVAARPAVQAFMAAALEQGAVLWKAWT